LGGRCASLDILPPLRERTRIPSKTRMNALMALRNIRGAPRHAKAKRGSVLAWHAGPAVAACAQTP
jgi:hypothetical protein